jgi:hypothetical protein
MATKKVKKFGFGGALKAASSAANKAAAQIPPKTVGLGVLAKGNSGPGTMRSGRVFGGGKPAAGLGNALKNAGSTFGEIALNQLKNKTAGPIMGSGSMAKANPLQKMGSGPSRQAMMKKGGMTKGYAAGGMAMVDKEKNPGLAKLPTEVRNNMGYMKKGGNVEESKAMVKKEIGFMKKAGAPKSMIKHEMSEAKGMKKGGMAECKTVAKKEVKSHEKRMHGMAKGGSIDGCAIRGKTKTSMVKMKRGGSC